jgi:hypothetical protein
MRERLYTTAFAQEIVDLLNETANQWSEKPKKTTTTTTTKQQKNKTKNV